MAKAKAKKKLGSVVGIDIGSDALKVVEFKSQGGSPVVTAIGLAPTPEGAVDHTGIFNPEAVGAALKALLSSSGVTSPNAVVTIAGQNSVMVRTLEAPRMEPTEMNDHMQWEVSRNNPFSENPMSDFAALPDLDPASPNVQMILAMAPPSAVDTLLTALKKAGKTPVALDVEPLAMARALERTEGQGLAGRTTCVVEIGAKTTSINIYYGSSLLMPRTVPYGGEQFTRALADGLGLGVAEAEELKRHSRIPVSAMVAPMAADPFAFGGGFTDFAANPFANPFADPADPMAPVGTETQAFDPNAGFLAAEPDPVALDAAGFATDAPAMPNQVVAVVEDDRMFQAIRPVLEELADEIRRTLDHYRGSGGVVDRIELAGGAGKLGGLDGYLAAVLGVPTAIMDPLRDMAVTAKKTAPDFIDAHRPDFAIAVGNGLHIFFD